MMDPENKHDSEKETLSRNVDPMLGTESNLSTASLSNGASASSRTGAAPPINPDDLHDLIGTPGAEDEDDPLAQLRLDPNYAALLKDLEAIRDAAKQLFAPTEPSDDLWRKIEEQLPGKEAN